MFSIDCALARPRRMSRLVAGMTGRVLCVLALVCLPVASVQAQSATSTPTPTPSAQTPSATPTPTPPSTSSSSHEHWMADLNAYIGNTPLDRIVIPGSHDTGTYGLIGPHWTYGGAQNVDLKTQLTHGIRWVDIRANYHDGNYFIYHGLITTDTGLPLATVLKDLTDWANTPGHEREIILASISASQDPADTGSPSQFAQLCRTFAQNAGSALLLGSTWDTSHYANQAVYDLTPNQQAALSGQPRIITNWSACDSVVGDRVGLTQFDGYYANVCDQTSVIRWIGQALQIRAGGGSSASAGDTHNSLGSSPIGGFYTLSAAQTTTPNCGVPLYWMGDDSATLDTVKSWYLSNTNNARANLNILSSDFVQTNPVVEDAITMNQVPPLAAASAYTPIEVNLKTANGHFLTAVNGGGVGGANSPGALDAIVHTDARSPGAWETFWVQWLDDAHTKLALRTESGNYMTAVNGGGMGRPWGWINDVPLHTDAGSGSAWEAFTLNVNPNGGTGNLQPATLQTPDGHYVSAVNGGGYGESGKNTVPIHMDAGTIGPDEQFSVVKR